QRHGRIGWNKCSDAGGPCSTNWRKRTELAAMWRLRPHYKIIIGCSRNVIRFLIKASASLGRTRQVFLCDGRNECRIPTYKERDIGVGGVSDVKTNATSYGRASRRRS